MLMRCEEREETWRRGKKNNIALLQQYNLKNSFQENKFEYLKSLKFNNIIILKYN